RLPPRAAIREALAVEHEPVVLARARRRHGFVDAIARSGHLDCSPPQAQAHLASARSPHAKLGALSVEGPRAERPLPGTGPAHSVSGTSQIAASGGSVTSADTGCP